MHVAKVPPPAPAAIRPVAKRLPDWAIAHAAVAEAAVPCAVPPLWHLPPAVGTSPSASAVAGSQPTGATGDQNGGRVLASLPAVHREPPPTVMLFGTNLRLVATKAPLAGSSAAAPATVLQSLEEKIRELNEVRDFGKSPLACDPRHRVCSLLS